MERSREEIERKIKDAVAEFENYLRENVEQIDWYEEPVKGGRDDCEKRCCAHNCGERCKVGGNCINKNNCGCNTVRWP